jgi:hypothetical protein
MPTSPEAIVAVRFWFRSPTHSAPQGCLFFAAIWPSGSSARKVRPFHPLAPAIARACERRWERFDR